MKAYAGVDLGGTNLRAVLIDTGGQVICHRESPVGPDRRPEALCDRIANVILDLVSSPPAPPGLELGGVGVGVAAWLERDTGRVRVSPNLGWRDVPIGDLLRQAIDGPVLVVNDLAAVTYGEWQAGAAREMRDVLCVFVGSGLGAGLVIDGRLYQGSAGMAGELGHVSVDDADDALPCGCGRKGCVEAYVGGRYLEGRIRAALAEGSGFSAVAEAARRAGRGPDEITCHDVETAYVQGDPDSVAIWTEAADRLGRALAVGVQVVDPGMVVLGGGVLGAAPSYRSLTLEAFKRHCPEGLRAHVALRSSALGGQAGVLGAALLARDRPD